MTSDMIKKEEVLEILLKEYEVMRAEVRMYINKQYLALTAIIAILTAGVFKTDLSQGSDTFIWIPFVVATILGFIAMVSFFVNKTAGYIRLVEFRIDRLYVSIPPASKEKPKVRKKLAPLFWENYYADIAMDRDKGKQLLSKFGSPIFAMLLPGLTMLGFVMWLAYKHIAKFDEMLAIAYIGFSVMVVLIALGALLYTNTSVRSLVRDTNKFLITNYDELVTFTVSEVVEIKNDNESGNKG